MVAAEVVERLRASKKKTQDARREQGLVDGREWASGEDVYEPLERLAFFAELNALDELCASPDHRKNGEFFYQSLYQGDADGTPAEAFWEDMPDCNSPTYLRAFADGALEVWDAVKGQI